MTREEEIWNAINNLQIGDYNEDDPSDNDEYDGSDLQNAFYAGAEWADSNPKSPWISVEDDLPCNHNGLLVKHSPYNGKLTKPVLTLVDDGSFQVCDMVNEEGEWEWSYIGDVIYWMQIPELPKE